MDAATCVKKATRVCSLIPSLNYAVINEVVVSRVKNQAGFATAYYLEINLQFVRDKSLHVHAEFDILVHVIKG